MTTGENAQSAIIAIMGEEIALYERLAEVTIAKREALLGNEPETLTALVTEMESLTRAIERLEEERQGYACALAGGTDVTFRALLDHFPAEDRPCLEALREHLLTLVNQVRAINSTNAALVRQALLFTERWSRLLRSVLPATYAPSGAVVGHQPASRAWSA